MGMLAAGGDAAPGKAYIVGERGPEVMVPKSAGTVMPNSSLAGLMGGGNKNVNISLTHNVTAIDSGGIKDMLDEHGPLFAQSLMDHLRKSNAI